MACGCRKTSTDETTVITVDKKTGPLDQCLFCAQKHADEALCCMNEFMYELENRSFVHGSIRSVVNHTFKSWPEIAMVAREAALLWQEARHKEAQAKLVEVIKLIDASILSENPDIKARLEAAAKAKEKPDTEPASGK